MSIFKMSMNFLKLRKIFVGVYKLILFMEIGILMTDPSKHLLIKKNGRKEDGKQSSKTKKILKNWITTLPWHSFILKKKRLLSTYYVPSVNYNNNKSYTFKELIFKWKEKDNKTCRALPDANSTYNPTITLSILQLWY